jgi:hypothetical protein
MGIKVMCGTDTTTIPGCLTEKCTLRAEIFVRYGMRRWRRYGLHQDNAFAVGLENELGLEAGKLATLSFETKPGGGYTSVARVFNLAVVIKDGKKVNLDDAEVPRSRLAELFQRQFAWVNRSPLPSPRKRARSRQGV